MRAINAVSWLATDEIQKHLQTNWKIISLKEWQVSEELQSQEFQVLIGFKPRIEILQGIKGLKLHITPSAGYEWADPMLYSELGITLVNSHANAVSVAEHAIGLLFDQAKQISFQDRKIRETKGIWPHREITIRPSIALHGKTALILGTGAIGTTIAKSLQAFNVKCIGIRRKPSPNPAFEQIGTISELSQLLPQADFVIVTLPLNKETENMIGQKEFKLMKPNAILINVGRSRVIDEEALFDALKKQRIKGAGIDVVYLLPWEQKGEEKKMNNLQFHELPNVTISPYRAWTSDYTFIHTARDIARKLDLFANNQPLPDVVINPSK